MRIGVVVVNWNGLADTLACLESLVAATPGPTRIVVVDNGSTDGSLQALRAWQAARRGQGAGPAVTILASSTNRGFSGANNIGLEHLGADPAIGHFLLLNNDATVDPGFFAAMARALAAAPDAAIMGATIYVTARPGEVWYAGGRFLRLRSRVEHQRTVPRDATPLPTEFVTGCALLISRRAWETLGPLPQCYFMYFEDAEYSWRAHTAGLSVLYAPRAVVYHAVGASVARGWPHPRVVQLETRNRNLFVRRNFRGWTRWSALAYLVLSKPGRAIVEVLRGRPALGWAYFRGTIEGLLASAGPPARR
jgi:GT2 family glycosyltransferase